MREIGVAMKAAREAGKILLDGFGRQHEVKDKGLREIVTEIDKESEKRIIGIISKNFPDHTILSEESGIRKGNEYMWIVDPLDGTTNYSIRHPFFNVSICLAYKKEPLLGVTYAPYMKELFHAEKGKGSFLNGNRIRVSEEPDLSRSLITFCHGKNPEDLKKIAEIFPRLKTAARDFDRLKSGALELAYVACGRLGGFLYNNARSWDVMAGVLLVREAGGRVTDFAGNEWDMAKKDLLATNGKLHQRILMNIKK